MTTLNEIRSSTRETVPGYEQDRHERTIVGQENMTGVTAPTLQLPEQVEGYKHCFHVMVKPIGSRCNLSRTYCYYLSKQGLPHQPAAPRMSDEEVGGGGTICRRLLKLYLMKLNITLINEHISTKGVIHGTH